MPEGPELRLAANFINQVASIYRFTGKVVKSDLATKLVEVPFEAETYALRAESRGKELKVFLNDGIDDCKGKKKGAKMSEQSVKHLLFRFGMSGCFKLTSIDEIPKHAHLRFFTKTDKKVLSFVDYRRFGSWTINGDWGSDRGPDPVVEYPEFRQNVLDNLEDSAFNKAICETLLNQKFFNGIGNYLRAEILFRCQVPPFVQARQVLEPLTTGVKSEDPDILELCHLIPKEVLNLGGGKGYDVEHDPEEEANFMNWLRCYYQDGMNNLVDHNGRTIWFKGPPGPMKPANSKSRGKRSTSNKKKDSNDEGSPVKKVKKEAQESSKATVKKNIKVEKESPKKPQRRSTRQRSNDKK